MKRSNRLYLTRTSVLVLALVLGLFLSLAGHAAGQSPAAPEVPPSAAAGLSVNAERCANCHGSRGLGDGELAANLPNPPAAYASLEYLRAAVPSDMFDVITNGIVPRGMPPFGPESSNPLTDEQRWNLIAAVFSLGTPVESVGDGNEVYVENCLACHGEEGLGDGPEAEEDPGDLTSLAYWSATSNQAVFDLLSGNQVAAHAPLAGAGLTEDDLWSVVDYMRTFSYEYTDALVAFRPLDEASITGSVVNGTNDEALSGDYTIRLRAFDQDLNNTLSMTTTLDAEGNFAFDLTDVPQEWFYRVATTYDGVDFGSDFGQLSLDATELDLPITVFDSTDDPAVLNIQQLHVIVSFGPDTVQINELYQVDNEDTTVFVGENGDPEQGTFVFALPDAASQLSFQRGFGSMDSFVPAQEVIATADGYADTIPMQPGPGSLTMLVSYELPYEDGISLSHPVKYSTSRVNLVLQNAGVELADMTGWVDTGETAMGDTSIATYGQSNLAAGSEIAFVLEGTPRATSSSSASLISDNSSELLIGALAAAVVIGLAVVVIGRERRQSVEELDQDDLLQALADLDDEYEAGDVGEKEYWREREALKAELAAIWQNEEEE